MLGSSAGSVVDGSYLRYTDTGYHTGGADRTRADTNLNGICTGFDQGLGGLSGGNIAGDEIHIRGRQPLPCVRSR